MTLASAAVRPDETAPAGSDLQTTRLDPAQSVISARQPPTIPGYVLHTLLGRGAYGEVWLGENRTTKRQVAVKFLHSRATLDWWLLDGETEKLAFLAADRRVVQLLDVGRDADPPYFVMEYVSRGSLADHLHEVGVLPVERTVSTFEEIALGLVQVHAKGILHCDLKPSNILLDDELRPRLADFGQSRLTDERGPTQALGTMFYMAPEQADPAAVPDARWDVYALGAVLYTMLAGAPPHQTDEALTALRAEPDLAHRLARYRQLVTGAGGARAALASLAGRRAGKRPARVDKPLLEILGRCLAVDARERYSTAQEVVEALRRRREARSRRPIILLGGLGPVLLLAVMIVFGVRGYREATVQSADAIRQRAFESNKFAAAFIARSLEAEVRRYFDLVSEEAARPELQTFLRRVTVMPELSRLAQAGPDRSAPQSVALVEEFVNAPERRALDAYFRQRLDLHLAQGREDPRAPRFVSMFAVGAEGTHLGAAYEPELPSRSVGRYYAWRSYFHGGPQDLPRHTPRERITAISEPHLSAPFRSTTTRGWRVGVSIPLMGEQRGQKVVLAVLVFSVDIGNFELLVAGDQPPAQPGDRFAVLVDMRGGQQAGRITLHPFLADVAPEDPNEPRGAGRPFIDADSLTRMTGDWRLDYQDPLGNAPGGAAYQGVWIAAAQPVSLPGTLQGASRPEGLVVLVQERAAAAIGPVERLGRRLVVEGLLALLAVGLTVSALWFFALSGRWRADRPEQRGTAAPARDKPRPLRDRSTLSESVDG